MQVVSLLTRSLVKSLVRKLRRNLLESQLLTTVVQQRSRSLNAAPANLVKAGFFAKTEGAVGAITALNVAQISSVPKAYVLSQSVPLASRVRMDACAKIHSVWIATTMGSVNKAKSVGKGVVWKQSVATKKPAKMGPFALKVVAQNVRTTRLVLKALFVKRNAVSKDVATPKDVPMERFV